ncbi:DNA polymerase IV [Fangia hongkongensis]|uniref:DNA polymerase IV n=1 Tax=Fangia hongkongensis TaxID=270495 RepID=UPI00038138B4|nr:DNA polymerase IV [Fangia hongkongensis]MBK2125061.1 DNA polymerase IV [Fangia hongkongensis]
MVQKIIHIDLDYFYAQVEERDNPKLKGQPVAVGGSENRGVLATCNYIARDYGLHSAMPTKLAKEKCPHLIVLPTNMQKYKAASTIIRQIFYKITPIVEPLSLDEAYLDVTDVNLHQNSATLIAKEIKHQIFTETQLTASAGIAPNKLLAKIASDLNKPNGLYTIRPKEIDTFIHHLPVSKLFGVGHATKKKLSSLNIEYCHQLQKLSLSTLQAHFGKFGNSLYYYCRGMDKRVVNPSRMRKSISVEQTFSSDLNSLEACQTALGKLYPKLLTRISNAQALCISSLVLKITDNKFNKYTLTRQAHEASLEYFSLLLPMIITRTAHPIRLLGIGVQLSEKENKQLSLKL